MKFCYLDLILGDRLDDFVRGGMLEVFPGFSTVNPAYKEKLLKVQRRMAAYIGDESLQRPFLYLILGPPGAGKSYLVNRLTNSLEQGSLKRLKFQAANFSEMTHLKELHKLLENIKANSEQGFFTVTFLDEFDVKFEGGSAIRFLINPIYDGQFWDGAAFQKFGRCAFFFAGSYLQDRGTLRKAQRAMAGIDLGKFLLDLYLEMQKLNDREAMRQIKDLQGLCHTHQRWRSEADPFTDTITYLGSLEKIKDFLSRIGGNVFEIQDLSWPLGVTQEHFIVDGREVKPSARLKVAEVIEFVKNRESEEDTFLNYAFSYDPLLEYKNALLCERLARVIHAVAGRFKATLTAQRRDSFEIDRKMLNYLTLAPLVNGMRSLEQLVNLLDAPAEGRIRCRQFDPEDIAMVIQDNPQFRDPLHTWDVLEENNPRLLNAAAEGGAQENDYIRVPLL
jgi:hypothetical protein